ncbi:MAG: ATPase [Pseudonocardiales bacterium]|nr:ATPase [Pseudonocardiales bacterium]
MTPAWRRYGRILLEREALAGGRSPGASGALTSTELDSVLGRPASDTGRSSIREALQPTLDEAQAQFEAGLDDESVFATVVLNAELTVIERTLLAVCAAAESDLESAALAGAAQGDRTVAGVTVGLLERLLGSEAVTAVQPGGRLQRAGLLTMDSTGPLPVARIHLSRTLLAALFGDTTLDPDLPFDAVLLLDSSGEATGYPVVVVTSPDRVRGAQAAAQAAWGRAFLTATAPRSDGQWRTLVAQATVLGTGVIVHIERDPESTAVALAPLARYWIDRADHLGWGIVSRDPLTLDSLPRRGWVGVEAEEPAVTDAEWKSLFGDAPSTRRPTADQLQAVQELARADASPDEAFRRLATSSLHGTAKRVVPAVGWSDLVLAPAHERRLRELVERFRHRETVHKDWGLPLYPSPGVVALFSGPSGTGKTTAAEVLAADLGVDMYRVDLSALVSKYIGETEKNLEAIFSAAHAGNYLLLFDEADSLFGSRSKVSDAKDRYANMEVSYLLQRLETYDGFVVLTSNFQGNIDQAFLRRMHATVHFPVPGAADRKRIWVRSLAQAPTTDLDLDFVAEKIDVSGGAIRNAALSAAFLAAAGSGSIDMPCLMRAVAQELGKLGRRATPEMFGQWQSMVSDSL